MHIDIHGSSWLVLVLVWLANVVGGACAGSGKRAAFLGGVLGAFLGPLGVVAALGLDRRHLCPICTGRLDGHDDRKSTCQHCGGLICWDEVTDKPYADRSELFREKNEPSVKTE